MPSDQDRSSSQIRVFDFEPDVIIRTDVTDDGEPIVSGADLTRAVGLTQPDKALARVGDVFKVTRISNTGGPDRIYLREPGVYQFLTGVRLRPNSPHFGRIIRFRRWVFEEVLPAIRRTGRYEASATGSSAPAVVPKGELPYYSVAREFRAAKAIAGMLGLEGNQGTLSALRAVKRRYGADLSAEFGLMLPSPGNEAILTPTELGHRLDGIGPVEVNKRLAAIGLQSKDAEGRWRPTEAGEPYGVLLDVEKQHGKAASVQQLKWRESVLTLLRRPESAAAKTAAG